MPRLSTMCVLLGCVLAGCSQTAKVGPEPVTKEAVALIRPYTTDPGHVRALDKMHEHTGKTMRIRQFASDAPEQSRLACDAFSFSYFGTQEAASFHRYVESALRAEVEASRIHASTATITIDVRLTTVELGRIPWRAAAPTSDVTLKLGFEVTPDGGERFGFVERLSWHAHVLDLCREAARFFPAVVRNALRSLYLHPRLTALIGYEVPPEIAP